MKIHVFIAHMGLGGAERVCVTLANEWAARGHEVHIVTLNLDNDINTCNLSDGINVHSLGVSRLRYSFLPVFKYIRKYKPKFMLIFGNEMAIIIQKLKDLHLVSVKLVVRVLNNVNISLAKEDNISPVVENYLKSAQKNLKKMDHIVAQCEDMGIQLINRGLVAEDKLSVIYNPVSDIVIEKTEKEREAVMAAESEAEGKKEVVFIGRIDPQKNVADLIDAFALVKKDVPESLLRIVGDGVLKDDCENKVNKLGLKEDVIFDGIRTDMEKVYASASVIALSSEYEGMPNCLIEAIGCGVPIVSYDCPIGPAEIVEDGVNGWLVPFSDKKALAESIKNALNKDWDKDKIKSSCDKFRVGSIAGKYEEIFSEL
jgi:glycosyltransferase involved in cell wall biosynthesis